MKTVDKFLKTMCPNLFNKTFGLLFITFFFAKLYLGFLSDFLNPHYGVEALRYALFSVAMVGGLWAAFHYAMAARTLNEDLLESDKL